MQRIADRRQRIGVIGLGLAVFLLALELVTLVPEVLARWYAYDYGRYVQMGRALLANSHSYGANALNTVYPLPTQLWVFVPLALLPDSFRVLWIFAPLVSLVALFRARALALFLFPPLWFLIGDGLIDGILLVPLALLLADRPVWAGLSAVLLLLKPQVAALAVGFAVFRWLYRRDRRNLGAFGAGLLLFVTPGFLLDPLWVVKFWDALPVRSNEASGNFPIIQASLWAWTRVPGIGWLVFAVLVAALLVWLWRAFKLPSQRTGAVQLANLALMPVLYAPSMVLGLAVLQDWVEIAAVVLVSWFAFLIDQWFGPFGGGYSLIPLLMMYLLSCRSARLTAREHAEPELASA